MELDLDFSKYPTLESASMSDALFVAVTGPAGSAKTTWAFKQMLRRAIAQEPNSEGKRYFKLLVVRNTYQVLTSATLDTARRAYGDLADFRESTPPTGKVEFMLPDETQVVMRVEFLSMDSEDAQRKLLGFEPTAAILDELSELPASLVHAVIRRLGRYPSGSLGDATWTGVIGVTNGPKMDHWLYEWSKGFDEDTRKIVKQIEAQTGRPFFHLYQQPPGLLRPTSPGDEWMPNPDAENIQHLEGGYGYYYAMLADSDDAHIRAYVEGDFAPLRVGKRVFNEFSLLHRIDPQDWRLPVGADIGLSFDFGRTPVCVMWTEYSSGRMIFFDAFMGEDMSVDTLLQDEVLPALRGQYRHAHVAWCTGDPSGSVGAQSVELSPYDVLLNAGLPVTPPASGNKLEPRLEAVRQYLRRLDAFGNPMLQVLDGGPRIQYLLDSLSKGYIYESVRNKPNVVKDTPTKSHVNWVSDLADAVQYACQLRAGMLRVDTHRNRYPLPPLETDWGLSVEAMRR